MIRTEATRIKESKEVQGTESDQQESIQVSDGAKARKSVRCRTSRVPITSFAQFVRTMYGTRKGSRRLNKADIETLHKTPALSEAERHELLKLAQSDRTLDKTKQLLLQGMRIGTSSVAGRILEFSREVLKHHVLFQSKSLTDVLMNHPQGLSEDKAVATLVSTDTSGLTFEDETSLTKSQTIRCRTNSVYCLLLLLRMMRGTSLDQIHRHMQRHLWSREIRGLQHDHEKLEILLTARDPKAASVTFTVLEDQVMQQGRRAEAATRAEERALARMRELGEQVAMLSREIDEAKREYEEVHQQLHEARRTHTIKDAHWRDDYERLRGRALRRLSDESSLLEEGLHALRRDPPRIGVMIDHAERAIEGLRRTAERIRKETVG